MTDAATPASPDPTRATESTASTASAGPAHPGPPAPRPGADPALPAAVLSVRRSAVESVEASGGRALQAGYVAVAIVFAGAAFALRGGGVIRAVTAAGLATLSAAAALSVIIPLLLSGLVGAFAFFTVVPRGRSWFSSLGSATLVVYLFHGFFVLSAEFAGYPGWAESHMPWALFIVTLCAVPVTLLLAWKPVSSRLNWLVDPVGSVRRFRAARQEA